MKTIIVACGGGIASSATVAAKINEILKERGLSSKAKAEAVDIKSLDTFMQNADIYVSITPTRRAKTKYPIPVVNGIPFLTGVGMDEAIEQIIKLIQVE
ncbi:PTS sugar transporter subunit IIB [Tepidanaerobacter syntrophicus]|uniref:PTS sugar transporter subunit IIB n=1 Tax=Tepidanaerobacter syntrophicus TaxID=224999 RepID=UPI001BD6C8BF|nr:PTS sugar transporter subunit IIB [Tepidanaerobacter syntrophicus]